jgi:hypothetical protein
MSPHNGRVNHGVFVVWIIRQLAKYLLPDPAFAPTTVAGMHFAEVSKPFGQVAPGDACPVAVHYGFDKEAIIAGRDPDTTGATR